jgi:hypothetical protein
VSDVTSKNWRYPARKYEPLTVSFNLNVFFGWGRVMDLSPVWATLVCWALSPGVLELNDLLWAHGHLVPLNAQWVSALFDIALGAAVGVMLAALRGLPFSAFPNWLRSRWTHCIVLSGALFIGVSHVIWEWHSIPMSARLGSNYLYHNLFLFPFLGYMVLLLLLALLTVVVRDRVEIASRALLLLLALALVGSWLAAGSYDGGHQLAPGGVPKAVYANPAHPYRDGWLPQLWRWAHK